MLSGFLDKIGGLFDSRFIIAYWAPLFVAMGLGVITVMLYTGWEAFLGWWLSTSLTEQAILGSVALFLVTILSYLLQALTLPLIRFYEGYTYPRWLANWSRLEQRRRWNVLQSSSDPNPFYAIRYHYFPRNIDLTRPTRLGNILTAEEEYSYQMYRLDAVLWWPRLALFLPETFRMQLDSAFTPLIALLNLSFLLVLLALGSCLLLLTQAPWWLFLSSFSLSLLMSRIAYFAATSQAIGYGNLIRVAFDLYRHDILKQMHIPVPDNLVEERLLWDALNNWIYYYTQPWESKSSELPTDLANVLNHPFYYDFHEVVALPTPDQSTLSIDGELTVKLDHSINADD